MIAFHKAELPAGGGKSVTANVTGQLFVCFDITSANVGEPSVEMQFENGQRVPCMAGLILRHRPFQRITFYNLSTTARTVHFWVGQEEVDYNFAHWQRPVRTIVKGFRDTITPGTVTTFEGVYNGYRRRFFYAQTTGTSNWTLRGNPNSDAYVQALVHPGDLPFVLETDAQIVAVNDSAANIEAYVTEVFHVGP